MKCTDIRTYDVAYLEKLLYNNVEALLSGDALLPPWEGYLETLENITTFSCELYRRHAMEDSE